MPRKKAPTQPHGAQVDAAGSDPAQRLIDAAFALARRQGWSRTGMADIAAEAGLPLHEAYALFPSKSCILDGFRRRIDQAVLTDLGKEEAAAQGDGTARRDRLFDTLMRRFDALQPHKEALRAILRDAVGDPFLLLSGLGLLRSMAWMLEASGIRTTGWRGLVRAQLLAGLYLTVLRVFFEDASPDLGKTMAALDRQLRRSERLLGVEPCAKGCA